MNIEIRNCRNIDSGSLSIQENKLNIKYGINGTGKSSITTALIDYAYKQNMDDLLPFKYRNIENNEIKTEILGIPDNYTVMVFNEDYINKFVFQKDELLNNSFEVFFKTDKYEELQNNITAFTNNISELFVKIPELSELINAFEEFISNCPLTKKGTVSGSSTLKKGLGNGNKLEHIPSELKVYKSYLKSQSNVEWIDWQIKGTEKFGELSSKCPYCAIKMQNKTVSRIKVLQDNYNKTYIKNLNEIIGSLNRIKIYLKKDIQSELIKIGKSINGLSDQDENLISEIVNQVNLFYENLIKLRDITLEKKKTAIEFNDYLMNYKIDLTKFSHFKSKYTTDKVNSINKVLKDVQKQSKSLYIALSKQKSYISNVISRYQKEIDDFLHFAGFSYHVVLEELKGTSSVHLLQNAYQISDIAQTFSYGEKNAFALVLFMYDALSKNPNLIILDDPISSFDGNKKYAIIHRLFLTKNTKNINSFRDKTVLLLTHDISIVVDIVHTGYELVKNFVKADYLENRNGILSEKQIENSNIESYLEIIKKNIEHSSNDITKLIFLRKSYEIENDKNFEWSLLSSLFHKRKKPTRKTSQDEEKPLGVRRTLSAVLSIRKHIEHFSYEETYKNIIDNNYMFTLFTNAKSNYEKLQIYRIINNKNHGNSVIEKFINESFHIDNDLLFHLNPLEYETVPDYIIEECKRDLKDKFNLG